MESMAWTASVHARLLDIDASMTIAFSKKLLEILDHGSLHEPAMIHDHLLSKPRGKSHGATMNTFKCNLANLGGRNVA
jgi:hypothetical protein